MATVGAPPLGLALVFLSAFACAPAASVEPRSAAVEVPAPVASEAPVEMTCTPGAPDRAPVPAAPAAGAVPLASLTRTLQRVKRPRAPLVDLGHVTLKERGHHREGTVDVALRVLPYDVPRADLPAGVARLWDLDEATVKELRQVVEQRVHADAAKAACDRTKCGDAACFLGSLQHADRVLVTTRARFANERRDLLTAMRHEGASGRKPGLALALARVIDEAARADTTSPEELRQALAEPLALYEEAAGAGASPEVAWYARYFRAAALEDSSAAKEAKVEYDALARLPATPSRTAEVVFRAAGLEADPVTAAQLYERAATSAPPRETIRAAAAERWIHAAIAADRFGDAIQAGLLALDEASHDEPPRPLDAEPVLAPLALAIGHVTAESGEPLPGMVPASAFSALARQVAEDALRRGDRALGLAANDAGGGRSPVAPLATTKPERAQELGHRLAALFRECSDARGVPLAPLDLAVTVAVGDGVPAKVTARAEHRTPEPLVACVVARGPAFFVDVPGDVRAGVVVTAE